MSGFSLIPSISARLSLLVHAIVEDSQPDADQNASGSDSSAAAGSSLLSQCILRIAGQGIEVKHVHPWKGSSAGEPIACVVSATNPGTLVTLFHELNAIRLEQQIREAKHTSNQAKRYRVRIGQVGYVHGEGIGEGLLTRRFATDTRKRERDETDVQGTAPEGALNAMCAVLIEGFLANIPLSENVTPEAIADRIANELKPQTFTQTMPQLEVQLREVYGASMTTLNTPQDTEAFLQPAESFQSNPSSLSAYVFCDFNAQTNLSRPSVDGSAQVPVRALGRLLIAFNPNHERASGCADHLRTLITTVKTLNGNTVRANLVSAKQFLKIVKACS